MSAKKLKSANVSKQYAAEKKVSGFINQKPGIGAAGLYLLIACILTFPLIFRMNSSVYGAYDHITTDLFAGIHFNFWWIKHSLLKLKTFPTTCMLFGAPYGSHMTFVNFTGFLQLPITLIFGYIFSRNFTILFNLVVSGLGMFYLVKHITKSSGAGLVAGIIFSFCPNMMVRSYTTFDTTQVQWIPFYTLFILKFIEHQTWKNALMTALFLICNIMFAIPYYLVFLPVHTLAVLLAYAGWRIWGEKKGFGGLVKDLTNTGALKAWLKIAVSFILVLTVFIGYYNMIVGGGKYVATTHRTTQELKDLSLKPSDYLMPHPRSALLKGNIKESYWETKRPGKDPDSFVAYIGFIALGLAITGIIKGRRGPALWIFIATAAIAFWATMGPTMLGIPTPSGLIHKLYAPFARRILIYKVFVQMGIAALAGIGIAFILERLKDASKGKLLVVVLTALILIEYTLVPPALSVDLTHNPEVYEKVKALPDDSILIEVPLRRNNGNSYQGYAYYQTYHQKPLFNTYFGYSLVPERIQPFYTQMEVPLEAQEYANLAALRYLGVTHMTYHWIIRTRTVIFASFFAPGLSRGNVDGLEKIYSCNLDPGKTVFPWPYDYTFTDLYEITAPPCPVALTFDYKSPYEKVPGILKRPVMTRYGWASALIDSTGTFYYPVADGEDVQLDRLLRQGGQITAINMSDNPVDFSISFTASSVDSGRVIVGKWNNGKEIGQFETGPAPIRCTVRNLYLDGAETGILSLWSMKDSFTYVLDTGVGKINLPANAILNDFRVEMLNQ